MFLKILQISQEKRVEETPKQMFFREIHKIFKYTFYRTPPVAASVLSIDTESFCRI